MAGTGTHRSTIVDVARVAHVHPSTVSRVLNHRAELSVLPATRERVIAAAARLSYRPSALARSLRLQRTLTLGMLVPDIANTFLSGIIKGVEEAAHARGYTLILCNTADLPEREATYLGVLRERHVDGVLIASTRTTDATLETLRDEGFPFVLVNRGTPTGSDLSVVVDNYAAAQSAIAHLVERGHRRIAHLAGPQTTTTGADRAAGVRDALQDRGLPVEIVETEAWSEVEGYRAARRLFRGEPPTAVFGANDLIALGASRAARDEGLRVPDDVALMGFNDIAEAALVDLTSVHVAQEDMGAAAARLLIARLEGERIVTPRVVLPATLVARGSTAGPRRAREVA